MGSPSSRPMERPVSAACPSAVLKNAIRRATTTWLSPPSSGASTRMERKPRAVNEYSKMPGMVPAFASPSSHA